MLLVSIGIAFAGGAACMLPLVKGRWVNGLGGITAVASGLLAGASAVAVLLSGKVSVLSYNWNMPFGSFSLCLDSLAAFFILPVSAVCAMAGLYGMGYMRTSRNLRLNRLTWVCFLHLMASMLLVVSSANGILFLLAWEMMTLSSFFLVMYSHGQGEVRRAGWIYLTASHIGTAFLLVLFALLGGNGGSMDFAAAESPQLAHSASLFFILAVVGFGTKAGLVPMHVWLPEAHPAAPSHASAVMSGVMIKTGVYGILRTLTFLGSPETWPVWWGPFLIAAGALSGIYGALSAMGQRDIKRLLAYSSVENMGIIFMGLGLWMLGAANGNRLMSILGLAGAMVHIWNHSVIKSLLFLGAGAAARATGTRDIQKMGGLLRRMKHTGLAVCTGSAAISGLPPLNGFIGEFLVYWAAFTAFTGDNGLIVTVSALFAAGSLALTGGLALACFIRFFGIAFLGTPRSRESADAMEVPPALYIPMLILAAVCVLGGILSPLMLAGFCDMDRSIMWKLILAAGILPAIALMAALIRKMLLKRRSSQTAETWGCGFNGPLTCAQYSASSFSRPSLLMLRNCLNLRENTNETPSLFPERMTARSGMRDIFLLVLYKPLFRSFLHLSRKVSGLQHGRNQLYILYIAVTLIVLLLWKLGAQT